MKSMTGMGKSKGVVSDAQVRVEIKTVNHRYCDVNFRAPWRYAALEIPTQQFIKENISRGRVEINIFEEKAAKASIAELSAFTNYYNYLNQITKELNLEEPVSLQHLLPGIGGWIHKEIDTDTTWKELKPIVLSAIIDLNQMREKEGASLKKDIIKRFTTIENIKKKVDSLHVEIKDELEQKVMDKLNTRIKEVIDLDPQRLHAEVLFYSDRMDVSEELERLESHFSQVKTFFEKSETIGRKIDFLLQEFNREFNTISSKASHAQVAHLVVEAKSELEKIREQVQNIE
jgi:uncharacterized protein (TIGR00255 family)